MEIGPAPAAESPERHPGDEELARQFPGAIIVARDASFLSDNTAVESVVHGPGASAMNFSQQSFSGSADFTSVIKAVTVSAASSVLSGYDQGVIAAAMLTMRPALGLSNVEEELSIGVVNIAAAAGGLVAGHMAERYGRKMAICLANLFFLVGSVAIAVAQGFWLLFIGRALQGVGVGFALVVAPVFTAELVPAKQRGMLVSLSDCSTNLGILLGYSSGLIFLKTPDGWRWMFAVGGIPAVALIIIIWAVPESPRWLVGVGRDRTALSALNVLYSTTRAANKFLTDIRTDVQEAANTEHSGSWRQVFWHSDRTLRGMIWRGLAIAFLSQAMGTEAVVYYTPKILREAGIETDKSVLLATMAVGGVKLLVLLIASQLFDRLGRRPLLLVSAAGILAGLVVMAAGEGARAASAASQLAIVGLCVYMAAFSLGFSPLTYVICSELFPSSVRARAMSLALFTTRIVAGIIASTFVSMREGLGGVVTWLFFVPIAAIAFVFVFVLLPETRGYTLEDIVTVFKKGSLDGGGKGGAASGSARAMSAEEGRVRSRNGGRGGNAAAPSGLQELGTPSGGRARSARPPPPSLPSQERAAGGKAWRSSLWGQRRPSQSRGGPDGAGGHEPAPAGAEAWGGGAAPATSLEASTFLGPETGNDAWADAGSGLNGEAGEEHEQGQRFEDAPSELPQAPAFDAAPNDVAAVSVGVGGGAPAAAALSAACAAAAASAQALNGQKGNAMELH